MEKKHHVGQLAHVKEGVFFEYTDDFVDSKIEISPFRLPLRHGVYEDKERVFHGLPGVFYDSLPDGWGMLLMDRFFRQKGVDPFSLSHLQRLAYIGNRAMGALSYEPATKINNEFIKKANLSLLARECEDVLRGGEKEILPEIIIAGGSPGGARPKVLVLYNDKSKEVCMGMDGIPEGFEPYIVKFSALTDFKDMGAVELAYMKMAKEAGIETAEARLFDAGEEGKFFGVKRFDRKGNVRTHMHTLSGLLHADYRIPNLDYKDFLKATWLLTKDHEQVIEGFRMMVFNILAHNRDDHSKNFSFLLDSSGWQLAPAYDLTFSSGIAGEHTMTIAGEGANPSHDHILRVARKADIPENIAISIIEKVKGAIEQWEVFAEDANVTTSSAKEIQRALQNIRL